MGLYMDLEQRGALRLISTHLPRRSDGVECPAIIEPQKQQARSDQADAKGKELHASFRTPGSGRSGSGSCSPVTPSALSRK
jgi:hypothetical protein